MSLSTEELESLAELLVGGVDNMKVAQEIMSNYEWETSRNMFYNSYFDDGGTVKGVQYVSSNANIFDCLEDEHEYDNEGYELQSDLFFTYRIRGGEIVIRTVCSQFDEIDECFDLYYGFFRFRLLP